MMNCRDLSTLCSLELDAALDEQQHQSMDEHLAVCDACKLLRQQLDTLRQAAKALASGSVPTEIDK